VETINVKTNKRCEFINITREVQRSVDNSGTSNGIAYIFVPHTTAGITINENADPDVVRDLLFALDRAVPNSGFAHGEGNSDAHAKTLMTGTSVSVIIEDSKLVLGTWQGVYFCEYDGPRQRKVYIKIIGSQNKAI
jgi:secondary thiamine-phosphate synthase enzyme